MTHPLYDQWLRDRSRDANRVMLVHFHATGDRLTGSATTQARFASKPVKIDGIPYYNGLINIPVIESSTERFTGIGDLDVVKFGHNTRFDWSLYDWPGTRVDFYFGDETWTLAEFKPTHRAFAEQCRRLTENTYRFELYDNGRLLEETAAITTVIPAPFANVLNVQDALNLIYDQPSLPNLNTGSIPADVLNSTIRYNVTDTVSIAQMTRDIVESVGGFVRFTDADTLQFVIPTETGSIASKSIKDYQIASMEQFDTIPGYANVELVPRPGAQFEVFQFGSWQTSPVQSESIATNMPSTFLTDSITIETSQNENFDVQDTLLTFQQLYDRSRPRWRMEVLDIGGELLVGDPLTVTSDRYGTSRNMILTRKTESPARFFSTIEAYEIA